MKSWEMVLGMLLECRNYINLHVHNFYVVTNVPLRHEIVAYAGGRKLYKSSSWFCEKSMGLRRHAALQPWGHCVSRPIAKTS